MKKRALLFFILFVTSTFGQSKGSLEMVLLSLSKQHGITFSYNTEQIKNVQKIVLASSATLSAIFLELSKQTDLLFEKIDDKNYVVVPKPQKIICGILLSDSSEPIGGATITYQNKRFTTNARGEFSFTTKDNSSLVYIYSLGCRPVVLSATQFSAACTPILLTQEVNYLDNIIIKNYLTSGINKRENGSLQINLKKTGILPGVIEPDVLQSLQLIPGVQSPDETASGLHIRGGTPDQNLVLFDGIKTYQNAHFFGLISVFNPYVVDNIQLYRSGTNARFGGTTAGVLEMNTVQGIPQKTKINAGSTFTHADLSIETPLGWKKMGLVASARKSISGILNAPTFKEYASVAFQTSRLFQGYSADGQELKNLSNDLVFEDYSIKLSQKIGRSHLLNYNLIYNKNDLFFGGISSIDLEVQDKINTESSGQKLEWAYDNESKGLQFKVNWTYTDFDKEYSSQNKFDPRYKRIVDLASEKQNSIKETTYNALVEKKIAEKHKIQLGWQQSMSEVFFETKNYGGNLSFFKDNRYSGADESRAIFAEYEAKLGAFLINFGFRSQKFKTNETTFIEPRFYLNYQLNKYLGFKIATEIKHQSIRQITDFRADGLGYLFDKVWVVTNRLMPVLESQQSNFGLYFQKNNWTIDLECYTRATTGINYLINSNKLLTSLEMGESKNWGIDLLLNKQINNYKTWVSYSYSKSRYVFKDLNKGELFDGDYDSPHHLIWSHNYTLKAVEFSLGWRYHTGTPYTERKFNKFGFLTFDEMNNQRLPDYKRFDFSVTYAFNWGHSQKIKSKLSFTLQNITNQENVLSREFQYDVVPDPKNPPRGTAIQLVERNRYALGITPNVAFRVAF